MKSKYPSLDKVFHALISTPEAHTATLYLNPKTVVRVTHQRPWSKRAQAFRVQVGAPNYAAQKFIKAAKKAGEPFPIKKVQLKFLPNAPKKVARGRG